MEVIFRQICFIAISLQILHVQAFQSCPSVCTCKWKNGKRWVECQKKQQISIPDNIDPETQVLDLGGNNLQILPREVFSRHGLLNLQKLKLSHCKIGQIDPTAFRGLTNLVELDLSSNLLTSVPTPTFSDIPYLRELALNNNPLQRIEGHAFEMVPQIVALDVSGCQIKKISARAFHNIEELERLHLHNNKIEELKQKTVGRMEGLHSLSLHGNPWRCDCHLRPLINWLMVANLPMVDLPRCKSPARLEDQRFADVSLDNFACTPELLSSPRYLEANVGSNASLTCKIGSVPSATIKWRREGEELQNSSVSEEGGVRKFTIVTSGDSEHTVSHLVVAHVSEIDGGQYSCLAENKAGRVETNLTLNVGYFSGPASLNTGEIVGISITMVLVLMIIVVIIAVLILKMRPGGREKASSGLELSYSPGPVSTQLHCQDGSVVINGTTYTQSSSTTQPPAQPPVQPPAQPPAPSGLTNGYINPDVIPNLPSPQPAPSLEMVQNRLNSSTAVSGGRYQNLPLPQASVGVEAALTNYAYSPNILVRNSLESNRMYGSGTLRGSPGLGRGTVNDCFSDDSGGAALFHRDMRLYSGYSGYSGYSDHYTHSPHLGSASPFFHGSLPRNLPHEWVSSPLRLPDWREQDLSYPPDYGLPIPRGSVR